MHTKHNGNYTIKSNKTACSAMRYRIKENIDKIYSRVTLSIKHSIILCKPAEYIHTQVPIYLLLKSYTKYKRKIKIYKGNRTIHSTRLSVTQYKCS